MHPSDDLITEKLLRRGGRPPHHVTLPRSGPIQALSVVFYKATEKASAMGKARLRNLSKKSSGEGLEVTAQVQTETLPRDYVS